MAQRGEKSKNELHFGERERAEKRDLSPDGQTMCDCAARAQTLAREPGTRRSSSKRPEERDEMSWGLA